MKRNNSDWMATGEDWLKWDKEGNASDGIRANYIRGFYSGLYLGLGMSDDTHIDDVFPFESQVDIEDLLSRVNKYYADDGNMNAPIYAALTHVNVERKNKGADWISEFIQTMEAKTRLP
jgi:hypothetical protein